MNRLVAVLATAAASPLELAMLEDVLDLVSDMAMVQCCLAVPAGAPDDVRRLTWPGTPVVDLGAAPGVVDVLDALLALRADEAAVVAADAPDLPALLLGKLHSALTSAEVAVCPSDDGGLVAVAARLPAVPWLRDLNPTLDDADALGALRQAAPRRALHVGPGWHRVSGWPDALRLDRGLEGWEATRALVESRPT